MLGDRIGLGTPDAVVAEHGQPEGLRRESNALAHDVLGEAGLQGESRRARGRVDGLAELLGGHLGDEHLVVRRR